MMVRKSNSDGCGCGKPKCSGCNKYRAGGMLNGGQKRLDKNGNGKIDANDFELLRKYMSGGMVKDYMPGGMVKKYAVGGPVKGDPRKEVLATIASLVAADNAAQESGTMTAIGSEKSTDVAMPGLAAALRAIEGYEKPPEDIEPIEPTSPTVIKKEVPPPTLRDKPVEEKEVPEFPADFSGGKSAYEFSPTFDGNIQQVGARGAGTSGALSGVRMDFKDADGRMQVMRTRLEDVPEYITKDPYFERLLNKVNRNYFELERAGGSAKASQARKTPEAQMIGRILSGDITIEEAKRQANYQSQSF